jgi:tetratricopeptide (TPR) repeat protein
MIASHKILTLIKIIGIVATIPIFGTITVTQTSLAQSLLGRITTHSTTGSMTKFVRAAAPSDNRQGRQVTKIAQNTGSQAGDYLKSGTQKFWKQDDQGALADFDRAIQLDPNFVEAYNRRGHLKRNRLKDYQGALADFNRAISLEPNNAFLYTNRGILKAERLDDPQGAIVDFNRSISIKPDYGFFYFARGSVKVDLLKDRTGGIADTQLAAKLFKQEGDTANYQIATEKLKKWQQTGKNSRR